MRNLGDAELAQELEIHRVELEIQNEELREAQNALQAGLDRYTQLFDFAPIGYATLTPEGAVRELNHVGATLLEELRSRVLGKRFGQFVAPHDRVTYNLLIDSVLANNLAKTAEVELVRGRGESPVVRITASTLAGVEPSVLLAFEDITRQKRTEQRLREADLDLREADRRKDEFLAVLSHELRTPLSSILMHGQLLQQAEDVDSSVRHSGEVVERAAKAQARLIDDLLDVSRIVAGKLTLSRHPVNLEATVRAALDTVVADAKKKRIRLDVAIDPEAPQVLGDGTRMQQVVLNLLNNAIKFTPEGGRVQVTLDEVDRQARVAVRDNGAGIEPAFLQHVFTRFAQADASSTRSAGGLGLGLSIAASIVEAHGGTIRVASEGKGKGATFTIMLPPMSSVDTPSANAIAPSGAKTKIKGARLLVVEDDANTRVTLTQVLQRAGATVRDAQSSREAMQVFSRFKPDILLCDIAMPEEDGCSLLRRIRALGRKHGGNIPAVALTAFADTGIRAQTRDAGFNVHLVKPVDVGRLLTTIAGLLPKRLPPPTATRTRPAPRH
jgi:two-component system CheB/CheR fusion protein